MVGDTGLIGQRADDSDLSILFREEPGLLWRVWKKPEKDNRVNRCCGPENEKQKTPGRQRGSRYIPNPVGDKTAKHIRDGIAYEPCALTVNAGVSFKVQFSRLH